MQQWAPSPPHPHSTVALERGSTSTRGRRTSPLITLDGLHLSSCLPFLSHREQAKANRGDVATILATVGSISAFSHASAAFSYFTLAASNPAWPSLCAPPWWIFCPGCLGLLSQMALWDLVVRSCRDITEGSRCAWTQGRRSKFLPRYVLLPI